MNYFSLVPKSIFGIHLGLLDIATKFIDLVLIARLWSVAKNASIDVVFEERALVIFIGATSVRLLLLPHAFELSLEVFQLFL